MQNILFKKTNEPDGPAVFKFELTVEQDGECYVVVFEDQSIAIIVWRGSDPLVTIVVIFASTQLLYFLENSQGLMNIHTGI